MSRPPKDLLEQVWDFFASVSVATVIIFLIAATSILGTLVVQEGSSAALTAPPQYYPGRYGPILGTFLYRTGITRMYTSWWYLSLLFLLGGSLIICSLERFVPLWRMLHGPATSTPESLIKYLKDQFTYPSVPGSPPLEPLTAALKARRFRVLQGDGRLYADKGRWSRWGPYITHIGLLLILVGAMGRAIPGFYFDEFIWVRDGASVRVPNTNWYLRSNRFSVEYYSDGSPKSYRTDAVVVDGGRDVLRSAIAMNQPLSYKGVELYQSSFRQELADARVAVTERGSGKSLGTLSLDLAQPQSRYTAGEYTVEIRDYLPDFGMDAGGKPVSKSSAAINPAFVLEVDRPGTAPVLQWFFLLHPDLELDPASPLVLTTEVAESVFTTGLQVKRDRGIPLIYLGLVVITAGVICSFYLTHQRLWAFVDGERVVVGGWANRNQRTLAAEMAALAGLLNPQTGPRTDPMEGEER